MTKYEVIDSIINDLDQLTVQGGKNMKIVLNTMQNLTVLSQGLKEESERHNARVAELEKQIETLKGEQAEEEQAEG